MSRRTSGGPTDARERVEYARDLAKALRIALDSKDPMHYATAYLTPDRHTAVLRAATTLATAAQRMLPPAP